MKVIFRSNTLEIIEKSEGILSVIVKSPRKAKALNKLLEYYPKDTKFTKNDEVLFTAPQKVMASALKEVRLCDLLFF